MRHSTANNLDNFLDADWCHFRWASGSCGLAVAPVAL
jgi:hypothetical protein